MSIFVATSDKAYPGPTIDTPRLRQWRQVLMGVSADEKPETRPVPPAMARVLEEIRDNPQAIPLSVRRDLDRALRAWDRLAGSASGSPLLSAAEDLKRATAAEVAPFKALLQSGTLPPATLNEALRAYAGDRRSSFAYDEADYFFDELLGLDATTVRKGKLPPDGIFYQATPISLIRSWVEKFPLTAADRVYDLGCGFPRVVAAGALLTPATFTGIEYASEFAEPGRALLARNNIERASIINDDVRNVNLRDGTHFFLFNPFERNLMKEVGARLERIARNHPIGISALGDCQEYFDQCRWLSCESSLAEDRLHISVYRSGVRFG